jgi:hypothetical protein
MKNIIGLKKLRENISEFICVAAESPNGRFCHSEKGFCRSENHYSPTNKEKWKETVDFTKIKKDGANINDVLSII